MRVIFLVSLMLFFGSYAEASAYTCQSLFYDSRLTSDSRYEVPTIERGTGFVIPNENTIGGQKSLYASVPEGMYLSVGTERSFMGAGLAGGKIKVLVTVDVDTRVVLFNLVNKALLALAESRSDYLELRLRSSFEDIQLRLKNHPLGLSAENHRVLADRNAWSWWRSTIRETSGWSEFHDQSSAGFKGANYLFEDAIFDPLSRLAKADKIVVLHMSLSSPELRARIIDIGSRLNQKLSVIDFSNAWQQGYIGHVDTAGMIQSLSRAMSPETQLVFTYQATDVSVVGHPTVFKYWFLRRGDQVSFQTLDSTLSGMERSEPSRRQNPMDRFNRFDPFN